MQAHTVAVVAWLSTFALVPHGVARAQQPQKSVSATLARKDVQAMAKEIDRLVDSALAQHEQKPNAVVDDATFLRRAYLTIVGRIPTGAECSAFLQDRAADKRSQLVDQLLDSPGHVSNEANYWNDLLRARTRLMRQVSGEPFLHWIKAALQKDLPYDQFVREMLTATGPALQRDNGETGYLLRDLGMPHDSMANTLRVFLGTRLECAQCHNHPFDKWTQMDFYRMAAFQGGLQYRSDFSASEQGRALQRTLQEAARDGGRGAQQAARQMLQQIGAGLSGSGTGLERLPEDYKYQDARPGQPVAARSIFGQQVEVAAQPFADGRRPARPQPPQAKRGQGPPAGRQVDSRKAFADWLCSADNPRFAEVIANRTWARIFGRGVAEPLDDLRDNTVPAIPELFEHLRGLVVKLDWNLRQLERVLLNTQAFQRACTARELAEGEVYFFPGPLLRRMSAEQMWDSLVTLVHDDIDQRIKAPGARAEEVYGRYEKLATMTAEQLRAQLEEQGLRYTDPQKFQAMQQEKRQEEIKARQAEMGDKQREAQPLLRDLQAAQRRGDQAEVARITAELQKLGVPLPGERRIGGGTELARAADLPQPAPLGHLLRQFGQSDREVVDGGNTAASVPQVLNLMNGFLDERVWPVQQSALRRALDQAKDADVRIRAAYLTLLSRPPHPAELAEWRAIVQKEGESGLRDLVWVLFNSHEFRFIQ